MIATVRPMVVLTAILAALSSLSSLAAERAIRDTNVLNFEINPVTPRFGSADPWIAAIEEHIPREGGKTQSPLSDVDLGAVPRVADLVESHDYSNVWQLSWHLLALGRSKDEAEVVSRWIESALKDTSRTSRSRVSELLDYLNVAYLDSVPALMERGQYGRASHHVRVVVDRLRAIDPPPLDALTSFENEAISHALLLHAVLSDPRLWVRKHAVLHRLSGARKHQASAAHAEGLGPLELYFEGASRFEAGAYDLAWDSFFGISGAKNDPGLLDLALLMQARCIFWAHEKGGAGMLDRIVTRAGQIGLGGTSPAILRSISGQMRSSSFKTDIDAYLSVLERE